jgi:hypothetical protein
MWYDVARLTPFAASASGYLGGLLGNTSGTHTHIICKQALKLTKKFCNQETIFEIGR